MTFASTLGGKFALAACLFISSASVQAQDLIGDGFAQTASVAIPSAFASYATMPSGDRVVFDGVSFDIYDGAGGFIMNLGSLPGSVFNSFVALDPTGTFAVAGESSNGDIFRIALDGSGITTLGNLWFNYDAVFEGPNSLIISAATCGFGCGNDIIRMDATTGATTNLANVTGFSGPLAMALNGDLFYGTAGSSVTNGSAILRFTSAQLNGGVVLGENDAVTITDGWAGATSMDVDPVFGNVFLAESVFGGTSRVLEFNPTTGALADVVIESSNYLGNVEMLEGTGIGHFHAYQPQDGGFMNYSNGDIVTVRGQRPSASLTQVGPAATFQVQGAKPNSAVLVLFADASFFNPNYITTVLGTSGFQFHSSVPIFKQRRTPLFLPTDANGTATFQYFDPGNLAGTLVFQALITDENANFIGSSEAVLN